MSGSSASAATVVASTSKGSTHLPDAKPTAAKVPTNTCNNDVSTDLAAFGAAAPTHTNGILCSKNQTHSASDDHMLRYSPYPPFAPLPPPPQTRGATLSSSCAAAATAKTPKPTTTSNTYRQDLVLSCLRGTSTDTGRHTSATATSTSTTYTATKTITPMAGAGTKTYVINDLGRLTCTPRITTAKKITPTAMDTPQRTSNGSSGDNDADDDSYVVDTEDDDNASVSSLDISRHTQTIADALTYAGISTTIVVSGGQPKCLFADGASSAGNGCDADFAAKPPSGCRGLLAKFDEADADPSISSENCRSSSPAPSSNSSAFSSSSTCSNTGSSVSAVPCDDGGLNLGNEMNLERKVDTVKWKRRANEKNGKRPKKKRRRLAR